MSLLTHKHTAFWEALHEYEAWPNISVLADGSLEAPEDEDDDIYNGRSDIGL